MFKSLKLTCAGLVMLAPAAAQAEEWWLIPAQPGAEAVWFVDADSIATAGSTTEFRMLQANAAGAAPASRARVRCGGTADDPTIEATAIRRFVCATPTQRMNLGAMLGSLTPEMAANAVLAAPDARTRMADSRR